MIRFHKRRQYLPHLSARKGFLFNRERDCECCISAQHEVFLFDKALLPPSAGCNRSGKDRNPSLSTTPQRPIKVGCNGEKLDAHEKLDLLKRDLTLLNAALPCE